MDSAAPKRISAAKAVVMEGLLVAVAGLLVALGANAVSPRGLVLTRDYFPSLAPAVPHAATGNTGTAAGKAVPGAASVESAAAARLAANGLQSIDGDTAERLSRDPRFQQQLVIFIDARDDDHFLAGHVPGAFQFDRYHPEKYLLDVLTVCQPAEQVVVYCNGGDCEDSEFAATTLKSAGVEAQKLMVYLGGIKEWESRGLPIEVGSRQSGNIRHGGK